MTKHAPITRQLFRIWYWAESFWERSLVCFQQSGGSWTHLVTQRPMLICFHKWAWTQSCSHVGAGNNCSRDRKINTCNLFGRLVKVQKFLHTIYFKVFMVFHFNSISFGKDLLVNTREFKNILTTLSLHLWSFRVIFKSIIKATKLPRYFYYGEMTFLTYMPTKHFCLWINLLRSYKILQSHLKK